MKKIFILFGASGDLGKTAVEYFMNRDYDFHYYFARGEFHPDINNTRYVAIKTGDLSDEAVVEEAFSKISLEDAGYFLFSTVGGYSGGKEIAETAYSDWRRMLDMNLNSSFLIAKHFTRLASKARGGSICFMSALSSITVSSGSSSYSVSKNGLNNLVRILALEGKKNQISSNAIAPYAIDTPSNREWIKDFSKLVPRERICGTVQFLFENYQLLTGNLIEIP